MRFEWDERKRRANLEKHGIAFEDLHPVFVDAERVEAIDRRRDYGEARAVILAPLRGRLLHITYTLRGEVRRIISARRANQREQRLYERYRARHAGGHDH